MKNEILKILNEAKWHIVILIVIVMMVTLIVTFIVTSNSREEQKQLTIDQRIANARPEVIDPPITIKVEINNDFTQDLAPNTISDTKLLSYFGYIDFGKDIEYYYPNDYLDKKINLFFEKY